MKEFPVISNDQRLKALAPPEGTVRMVLDTDTYNEVDDQFALAYAIRAKEKIDLQAVYAAPFHNDRSSGPADGMEKSYKEIQRMFRLLDSEQLSALRGSKAYMSNEDTPVESPAASDLV